MDLTKYKTDEALEQEGVWVDIGDGAKLKIAHNDNPKHREALRRLMKPYRVQFRNGTLPDDIADNIQLQALVDGVLRDWEGIKENGKAVEFNRGNAIRVLTEYRMIRDLVKEVAMSEAAFRAEDLEDAAKN